MRILKQLFDNNKFWSERVREKDPEFFLRLSRQQSPSYLWIGCSDSRVPANQIVDLLPGEMFVHRNVANLVQHWDVNCMSVLQFAVDVLKVQHVIVCGHYGCGGIRAVERGERLGLVDDWLAPIRRIRNEHEERLAEIRSEGLRVDRLCELNVIEQARSVCRTEIVRAAWGRNQELAVHAWIYGINDGLLRDLNAGAADPVELTTTSRSGL